MQVFADKHRTVEEVSEDPWLIEVLLDIRPGTEMSLANGAAAALIVGTNQPTFRVNGLVKSSLDGLEFNYGAAVADVEIPTDWLHDEAQLFEVRASAIEATTPVRFAVSLKPDGTGSVDLAALIGGLGLQPGLRRVVVGSLHVWVMRELCSARASCTGLAYLASLTVCGSATASVQRIW